MPIKPITSALTLTRRLRVAPCGGRRWVIYVLAALLAIQAFLVQSHIHFPRAGVFADNVSQDRDHEGSCPLCQDGVAAGAYLLALPPVWTPPVISALSPAETARAAFSVSAPSFHWRGRAPPAVFPAT